MNRHLEFDQEFLARWKALFLTKFAVVPAGIVLSFRERRQILKLEDVVDKLGIPRPEDGNLVQALYEARPRIGSRSQWGDVDIIACDSKSGFAPPGLPVGDIAAVIENDYFVQPSEVARLLGLEGRRLGQLVRSMEVRTKPKKRLYYLADILKAAASLLDSLEAAQQVP